MVEKNRTSALGLFNFAHSYWASASALETKDVRASHADAPICYLYFHSVELYLKSYLLAEGHSLAELTLSKTTTSRSTELTYPVLKVFAVEGGK